MEIAYDILVDVLFNTRGLIFENSDRLIYIIVILLFLNALIMVPPSEIICLTAGAVISVGDATLGISVLAGVFANMAGTIPWYILGKIHNRTGQRIENINSHIKIRILKIAIIIYTSMLQEIEEDCNKRHPYYQIFWRNIPLMRSICSYLFGRAGVSIANFLFFTFIGIGVWVFVWTSVGYTLGEVANQYGWFVTFFLALPFTFVLRNISKKLFAALKKEMRSP